MKEMLGQQCPTGGRCVVMLSLFPGRPGIQMGANATQVSSMIILEFTFRVKRGALHLALLVTPPVTSGTCPRDPLRSIINSVA